MRLRLGSGLWARPPPAAARRKCLMCAWLAAHRHRLGLSRLLPAASCCIDPPPAGFGLFRVSDSGACSVRCPWCCGLYLFCVRCVGLIPCMPRAARATLSPSSCLCPLAHTNHVPLVGIVSCMAGYRITPVLIFWTGRALYWVKFTFETGFELPSSCPVLPCYAPNLNRNILDFMK
jgi:hypothetical protein